MCTAAVAATRRSTSTVLLDRPGSGSACPDESNAMSTPSARDTKHMSPPAGSCASPANSLHMAEAIELEVAGRTIRVSNPQKLYFPEAGHTKLDLVQYYVDDGGPGRQPPARAAHHAETVRGRRRRQVLLPKARAQGRAASGCRRRSCTSPAVATPRNWSPTTPPTWPGRSTWA